MNLFQSIFLGIIQGVTEFLPISSSGHLVIVPYLFGWNFPEQEAFLFNVLVQVASLIAVFAFFWRDLVAIASGFIRGLFTQKPFGSPDARLGWYLILATIPAGLFGLFLKERIAEAFDSVVLTALLLLFTAALLVVAEVLNKSAHQDIKDVDWKKALIMGFFQVLALFPGVSRSGSTITGGVAASFSRAAAARFSFLMSIPIMLAAGLNASLDLVEIPNLMALLPVFLPGFLAAAVVGYLSIRWLLSYLLRHSLYIFAAYCLLLSAATILVAWIRG